MSALHPNKVCDTMKATSYSLNNSVSQIEVDAGLLSETYTVSVEDGSKIDLPDSFSSPIREDIVRDAVHSSRANRRQPYGHRNHGGKRSPTSWYETLRGMVGQRTWCIPHYEEDRPENSGSKSSHQRWQKSTRPHGRKGLVDEIERKAKENRTRFRNFRIM